MPPRRQHATGCRAGVQRRHWLLGGVSAIVGCDHAAVPPVPAVLHMGMDLWAGYFPVLLAIELGLMAERGLTVDVTMPGNTDRMLAEFSAGRYDIVGMALADLVNLTRGARDVQVFIHSDESSGGDKLLSRAGFDPARDRVIVGTNLGGFGELFVREYLQRQGIDDGRVVWMNVDAADVPLALKRREIDIGHTWDPYAAAALADGAVQRFSSAQTPGLVMDVLATRHSVVERRFAELKGFTAAWFQAQQWWAERPAEGDARLARRLDRSPEWVAESRRGIKLADLAANRRLLGAGGQAPAMASTVVRYSDFFLARGTLTRPLQHERLLRADLLP